MRHGILLVLVLVSAASGQVPADEAARRLKDKQTARQTAATQPADQVRELQAVILDLRAEVARLRAQLVELKRTGTQPAVTIKLAGKQSPKMKLEKGQTFDEIVGAFGAPLRLVEDAYGKRADFLVNRIVPTVMADGTPTRMTDGWMRRLSVSFDTDGKVVDFQDEHDGTYDTWNPEDDEAKFLQFAAKNATRKGRQ